MRTIQAIVALVLFAAVAFPVQAGDIVIPDAVVQTVQTQAAQVTKIAPINAALRDQTRTLMRQWVERSFNLGTATQRKSTVFDRTIFSTLSNQDVIRLPSERLQGVQMQPGLTKPTLRPGLQLAQRPTAAAAAAAKPNLQAIKLQNPMLLVYREGPSHFEFRKMKELRAKGVLADQNAINLARSFILENKLLQTAGADQVGNIYIRQRRIAQEKPGGPDDDFLLQQDVVLERTFQGLPVVNSKIEVGLHPDTQEILVLKHYNWTPVVEQQAKPIERSQLKLSSASSPSEIRSRISEKIKQVSGNQFTRADVSQAKLGWFQTADKLIPVLVFEADLTFQSPRGPITEPYLEVINLIGNDADLQPQSQPPTAPTQAM